MTQDARIKAVAEAVAQVRYKLSAEPVPQELDYIEAERFVAMLDAEHAFLPESARPVESWGDEVARLQREIGERQMRLHLLVAEFRWERGMAGSAPALSTACAEDCAHPQHQPHDWQNDLLMHERDVAGDC